MDSESGLNSCNCPYCLGVEFSSPDMWYLSGYIATLKLPTLNLVRKQYNTTKQSLSTFSVQYKEVTSGYTIHNYNYKPH